MAPSPSGTDEGFRRQEEKRYRAHMAAVEQLARELGDNTEYSDDEYPTDIHVSRVAKSNAPSPSPHLASNMAFPIVTPQRNGSVCSLASTQRDHSIYSPPIPTIETQSDGDTSMSVSASTPITSESAMATFRNSTSLPIRGSGPTASGFHHQLHTFRNRYTSALAALGEEFQATLEKIQALYEAEWEKSRGLASAVEMEAQRWMDGLQVDLGMPLMSFEEEFKEVLRGVDDEFGKIVRP